MLEIGVSSPKIIEVKFYFLEICTKIKSGAATDLRMEMNL
jgi:hypothetical protein